MLEGYPTFIKYTNQGIDSEIYDKFYKFCEKKAFPITMHIANPDENWDFANANEYAKQQGRVWLHFICKRDLCQAHQGLDACYRKDAREDFIFEYVDCVFSCGITYGMGQS